ncbi:hypothetical protein CHS0354_036121 [Potamilus streckersoni]|uniref:ZP domain-containing protein n=1 Tax=Potamilus streckersoni TaxID=2493646 RepID=A0AAE0W6E5_9BIVA|nr:hypothetical protein CHS0354_036121 [Potamilus streckersoni]
MKTNKTVNIYKDVPRICKKLFLAECFPDGTVRIKNPGQSMYTAVFANNSANVCRVEWENESTKEHSIITNCEMNLPIMVTFMNRPSSNDFILGGKENIHFLIRCSEIPHTGVNKVAVDLISIRLSTTSIHITPFFSVFSRMYLNNRKSVVVTSTGVGVILYWVIEGPEEYHLMPLRCDVLTDRTSDNKTKHKNIIVDGCTEDSNLVGNFTLVKTGEVATEFRTFRFYNSPFVTIQCIVRVCPQGSVSCDFVSITMIQYCLS